MSNTHTVIGDPRTTYNPVFYVTRNNIDSLIGKANTNPPFTGSLNRLGLTDSNNDLIQFTDTSSAFVHIIGQQEYALINFPYPDIITNGLVGLYDAGFYSSYPTAGNGILSIAGDKLTSTTPYYGFPRAGELFGEYSYIYTADSGSINLLSNTTTPTGIYLFNTPSSQFAQYISNTEGTIMLWCKLPIQIANGNSGYAINGLRNILATNDFPINEGYGFYASDTLNNLLNIQATAGINYQQTNIQGVRLVNNNIVGSNQQIDRTKEICMAITWSSNKLSGYIAQRTVHNNNNMIGPTHYNYSINLPAPSNTILVNYNNNSHINTKMIFNAVYFYNRALSLNEINFMYQNTRVKYSS
jgi:hypothetical protein